MNSQPLESPATSLKGLVLKGWLVGDRIARKPGQTGGCFSVTYKATEKASGRSGFLKAVDLITKADDPKSLGEELNKFHYEEGLLQLCRELGMDGIVVTLESGIHQIDFHGFPIAVPFLIFEEAEGDLRTHEHAQEFNLTWRLRVFHGVCVAVSQLHKAEIAHQDLKPSNVLVFEKQKAKVADLGRATRKSAPSLFEGEKHQGDKNYQPIELLYGEYNETDWLRRRFGADFFMIGALLTYLVTDCSLLTLLIEKLDKRFWPIHWKGTFREVLPHLELAMDRVMDDIKSCLPPQIGDDLCQVIGMLACPNFERRGRPFLWGDDWHRVKMEAPDVFVREQYSLEYVISRADYLANEARLASKLNRTPFLEFMAKNR